MPARRLWMRKIKRILELRFGADLSIRMIAFNVGVGRSSVARVLKRAATAQLTWPLPKDMTDTMLEAIIYPNSSQSNTAQRPVPNWAEIHLQMARHRSLTLLKLWQQYIEQHPNGFRYSRFCDLYRTWRLRKGIG